MCWQCCQAELKSCCSLLGMQDCTHTVRATRKSSKAAREMERREVAAPLCSPLQRKPLHWNKDGQRHLTLLPINEGCLVLLGFQIIIPIVCKILHIHWVILYACRWEFWSPAKIAKRARSQEGDFSSDFDHRDEQSESPASDTSEIGDSAKIANNHLVRPLPISDHQRWLVIKFTVLKQFGWRGCKKTLLTYLLT